MLQSGPTPAKLGRAHDVEVVQNQTVQISVSWARSDWKAEKPMVARLWRGSRTFSGLQRIITGYELIETIQFIIAVKMNDKPSAAVGVSVQIDARA